MLDLAMLREYLLFHCLANQFIIQLIFSWQEGKQPHSQRVSSSPPLEQELERDGN